MKYCPKCEQQFDDKPSLCPADGRPLSLPDPYHLVGRVLIEKYHIDALVGIGGMGAVYSGRHLAINRRVAFKILLPNLALGNEKMLNLFQREAETSGQLAHENIVDVKDAGRTPEGLAYIVMEWLEGRTLEEELRMSRRLSFEYIARTLGQIAAALDYAHARLIVHRDLKPSNIMLVPLDDGREQVKVVDFGIAKVINDTAASPVSRIMGTPHYSSPEQFRIGADIDGRSDIYSLGVLLFQMLTGRLPFDGATPEEIMLLHRAESPPPVRGFRPDAPVAIEQLVERMLAKEPRFRPRTATEAAEVFERAISSPDQARTAPATRVITKDAPPVITKDAPPVVTKDAPPVITSGKTEPEQDQLSFLPTQIEEPVSVGDRVTTPIAPASPTPKAAPPAARHSQRQAFEPKGADGSGRGLKRLAVVVSAMLLLFLAGMLIRRMIILSRAPASARELMVYQLEILSADGKTVRPASGETLLANGESFKLRFTPRESGYLYIVAPDAENHPATFLTAQPDRKSGVMSNLIRAGTDFSFPADPDGWLEITEGESKMDFTLIFSSTRMNEPGFLAAPAGRKLTGEEQHELTRLRQQSGDGQIEAAPDARISRILLRRGDAPSLTVVELTVRRQ